MRFLLVGPFKKPSLQTPPASLQILRERIENAFMEVKDKTQVIRKAVLAVRQRANRCVERNGGQVECYQLKFKLYCTLFSGFLKVFICLLICSCVHQ